MTDLIARLRTMSATGWHPIGDEAAAEIDRLTRERDEAQAERDALAKDAAIGRVVWRFIDRMNDVCDIDPAERIVQEFVDAVYPAIEAALPERVFPIDAQIEQEERP